MWQQITRPRIITFTFSLCTILLIIFLPGLPWSAECRYKVGRLITKNITNKQREGRLLSLSGRVVIKQPHKQGLAGATVEVVDSHSGWATITDAEGRFHLPKVATQGATTYSLIITTNEYQTRLLSIKPHSTSSPSEWIDVGEIEFDQGCNIKVDEMLGRTSLSYLPFDDGNLDYYRHLFEQITKERKSDEEKILALNKFIAQRLLPQPQREKISSPRDLLENGSHYCGNLALAMATLAMAGNYYTRILDLSNTNSHNERFVTESHMVVEIYYDDHWHLFDPILNDSFHKQGGEIASYKEIYLSPELVNTKNFPTHLPTVKGTGIYHGAVHYYQLNSAVLTTKRYFP